MTVDSTLWELVAMQLTEHIRADQGDRTWLDALNRIARKSLNSKHIDGSSQAATFNCESPIV